ncbi:putative quinol monooxygenase [Pseudarthrobacter sp. H2]|uniref:putative quinol monooxygenase n=1 Tax=Pseudarthrobacter sp. H2 TaxID=3418415 RepID=UPI003CE8025C
MTSTFNVVVQYRTKPGTTDDVLKHLHTMATETRMEPGNISYEFFRGVEDDRKITILESYRSEEDFELHRQTPHCLNLGPAHIIPQLESRTLSTYVTAASPA